MTTTNQITTSTDPAAGTMAFGMAGSAKKVRHRFSSGVEGVPRRKRLRHFSFEEARCEKPSTL